MTHFLIWRYDQNPLRPVFIAVRHTLEAANRCVQSAGEVEAAQHNAAREARFATGQEFGREMSAEDFTESYRISEVIE